MEINNVSLNTLIDKPPKGAISTIIIYFIKKYVLYINVCLKNKRNSKV